MFEVSDVVIAGVGSGAIGFFTYSSIKKDLNINSINITDKKKRRQQKLAQKELWEHAAYATASGIALFIFFVFSAATNMSHFPLLPRLFISLVCFLIVLFILRSTTHFLFRYFRNRLTQNS